jgi:hypothetical protein
MKTINIDLKPALNYNQGQMAQKQSKIEPLLSYKEKQEWVDLIDQEAKSRRVPVGTICRDYGLQLHHYYNWSKALLKRAYKAKALAAKPVVSKPVKKASQLVKKPVAPAPAFKKVPPIVMPLKTAVSGRTYAIILTDKEHLKELLGELNG